AERTDDGAAPRGRGCEGGALRRAPGRLGRARAARGFSAVLVPAVGTRPARARRAPAAARSDRRARAGHGTARSRGARGSAGGGRAVHGAGGNAGDTGPSGALIKQPPIVVAAVRASHMAVFLRSGGAPHLV